MDTRTQVSMSVRNDRLDEVLHALRSLAPDIGPAVVNRSSASDGVSGISVSLPGDVRDAVHEQLDPLGLEYEVSIGKPEDF